MQKLIFSGHESFVCKQFWLKKGYDFIVQKKRFSDNSTVIDLGVGKNMVNSIRFWLKSFGISDENDNPSTIGEYLFGKNGKDLYIEDHGTIWLLHYNLVKNNHASIYNIVFNEYRKERFEFTKEQLTKYINAKLNDHNIKISDNTIKDDINVFQKTYIKPNRTKKDIEETFASLLIEIELLTTFQDTDLNGDKTDYFKIENIHQESLPYQVILYTILDNEKYSQTIAFNELLISPNSPGMVFALNKESLYKKIIQITKRYPKIIFSETAGNQVLQFKEKPDKWNVLDDYYG
ncbi:MAG: DUF4007 family protein [Leptospiraceae bacterium]|nr:DUF4007 family protein [Leptospiraceae bacterium]